MRIDWKKAVIAGILGTIAFDVVGFAFTQQWWDIPSLLGAKLGLGLAGGLLAHYANGILLAVIYAGIAPSLWGSKWTRATVYVTLETIFGVWLFMTPLLGAGVMGLGISALFPVVSMVRHWGYGLVLAWLIPSEAEAKMVVRS